PSMVDIQLSLMSSLSAEHTPTGSISWLAAGINIEDSQDLVREAVHQLPTYPTATQKANIIAKQLTLQSKVQRHQDEADSFMDGVDILEHCRPYEPMDNTGLLHSFDCNSDPMDAEELDEEDEYIIGGEEVEEVVPHEDICISMPSRLKLGRGTNLGLGHLVEEELQLRRGQANDSLAKLQAALGNLAILYRQNLQSANSVHSETRARKAI
ncbi:hypothetical protein PAXRUDRAFT_66387, partial [Paxillus rubicundulus Ve08.2h10]